MSAMAERKTAGGAKLGEKHNHVAKASQARAVRWNSGHLCSNFGGHQKARQSEVGSFCSLFVRSHKLDASACYFRTCRYEQIVLLSGGSNKRRTKIREDDQLSDKTNGLVSCETGGGHQHEVGFAGKKRKKKSLHHLDGGWYR